MERPPYLAILEMGALRPEVKRVVPHGGSASIEGFKRKMTLPSTGGRSLRLMVLFHKMNILVSSYLGQHVGLGKRTPSEYRKRMINERLVFNEVTVRAARFR
jgi:hypothetical protein